MSNRVIYLLLIVGACILFLPFLGLVHLFDWDEINFAECAREMVVSSNYARVQVEFLPFWEKPPLFFWLQAGCMHLFGVSEYAARLPNALVGIATLPILFYWGNRLYDRTYGLLWVFAYIGSFLPHFYFKTGIIDPLFNLWIFLSIMQLACLTSLESQAKAGRNRHAIWGGVFIGLAILTKGPVAVLIVGLCGLNYWIMSRNWRTFRLVELFIYGFVGISVASFWFLPEMWNNGFWFLREFLDYQIGLAMRSGDTGHEQPFWYHPVVLLVGCFPASIFFLKTFAVRTYATQDQKNFTRWMQVLFWVTLILFSIVKAKIVHYSSLCYFPLTFLATNFLYKIYAGELKWAKWQTGLLLFVGILWSILLIVLPFVGMNKEMLIPYIADEFTVANLQANVYWSVWESAIGMGLLCSMLYVGWVGIKAKNLKAVILLYSAVILTVQTTMYIVIQKIEGYSQRAVIDFWQSKKGENAYFITIHHSYAHYYYGEVRRDVSQAKQRWLEQHYGGKEKLDEVHHSKQKDAWLEHLLHGKIDRTVYVAAKINEKKHYDQEKNLQKISEKNGFIFYKRVVSNE